MILPYWQDHCCSKEGREVDLLPGGKARIEHALTKKLVNGGQKISAQLYVIWGLGLGPEYVWLNSEQLLFQGNAWIGAVRDGFEPHVDELVQAQEEHQRQVEREYAARIQRRPEGPVLFRDVRMFDAVA